MFHCTSIFIFRAMFCTFGSSSIIVLVNMYARPSRCCDLIDSRLFSKLKFLVNITYVQRRTLLSLKP